MKKLDDKGFMLIETLICATFIVGVLIFVYIQFTNINRSYEDSFTYNNVNNLYLANQARDYLQQENLLNPQQLTDVPFVLIECPTDDSYCSSLYRQLLIEKIVFAKYDFYNNVDSTDIDADFKKFIKRVRIVDSGYSLYIQFNDNTYAVLKVNQEGENE